MTELSTTIRKGHSGWRAETELPLGFEADGKPAFLTIHTYGGGGKIDTYAGVCLRDGMWTTTRVFRDYHERIERVAARGTEKAIRDRHAACLAHLDTIKAAAIAFHTAKGDLPAAEPIAA